MPGDIEGWLNIVDRLDVWGLAILCAVAFWKIIRSLDRIDRGLMLHTREIRTLEEWRLAHQAEDRDEHQRIHDRIYQQATR